MEGYTPPERPCPACREIIRVGYSPNWGITWFHKGSGTVACSNGGFSKIKDPTKHQTDAFIRANPWCDQIISPRL